MEENNAIDRKSDYSAQEEQSFINFQAIYKTIVLNWYWFILSLIICSKGNITSLSSNSGW